MRLVRPMVGPVGLVALVSSVILATCASGADGPDPTVTATPPLAPAAAAPAAGPSVEPTGSGSGAPTAAIATGDPGPDGSASTGARPGERIAGTDAVAPAPVPPDPALVEAMYTFGRLYLAYDHADVAGAARIEALGPLVTPTLLAALAQPLPPALAQSLLAEQRKIEAEPVGIEPLDAGTYLVSFVVTTTRLGSRPAPAGTAELVTTEELRTLVVTLDGDGLVSDVR